ncbi:mercury resistance system transport protein MerF [Fodinibius sp.]|uniref:mercury resistance system transport protein MerF n=1 Tax=Fodinibius sp. TaxID=1872440 RepID=UPI003566B7C4
MGTVIAALYCFNRILVWTFAAIGITAYIAYLDYVLRPALVLFMEGGYRRYHKKSLNQTDLQ